MFNFPGISTFSLLYESANSLVYRAIRDSDAQPLILKVLKEDYPTPQELARYRTEYRITQSLNFTGVVKVYDLQKYQNTLVMFVEDFGAESLKFWMQERSFSLEEFLKIAIATIEALSQIHQKVNEVINLFEDLKRKAFKTFCTDIETHRRRIVNYQYYQEESLSSIGSGTVESTIKRIGSRVKLSGAQWNIESVASILSLRCAYLKGQLST